MKGNLLAGWGGGGCEKGELFALSKRGKSPVEITRVDRVRKLRENPV